MFKEVKYLQNSFGITFPRVIDIRRKANLLEDALKEKLPGHYSQPQVIPVPDELEQEMPRLIFGSIHGFSQIIVSQISMILNVTYSPDWQLDIEKGIKYLQERIKVLFDVLNILGDIKPYFAGLTTRARLFGTGEMTEKDILTYLSNHYIKKVDIKNVYDLQIKITKIKSNCYFSNMIIQNFRGWKSIDFQQVLNKFPRKLAIEKGIEIVGDFNDRFAFNEKIEYYTDLGVAEQIIKYGFLEIKNTIKELKGAII